MNPPLSIYIFPLTPVFSTGGISPFEEMTPEDSTLLCSTLYLNYTEILAGLDLQHESFFCLAEEDREAVPPGLQQENMNVKFFNRREGWEALNKIIEKKIQGSAANVLVLFSNSICISSGDIKKIFDYLDYDDNTVVLGRSLDERLCFFATNSFRTPFFIDESFENLPFDRVLKKISCIENYTFQMDGYLTVNNLEDFRQLYRILSKKESIAFCSHEKHELFTNLFIEYKEFL